MSYSENKRHDREDDGDEITKRQTKKARKTPPDWLLLDRCGHPDQSEPDGGGSEKDDDGSPWTASEVMSNGARFQLSLHAQEPPGVTHLLYRATVPADVLTTFAPRDSSHFFLRPTSAKFSLTVKSSNDKAILLETGCAGVTEYLVMDHIDHSPPVVTRLPEIPPCMITHRGVGLMRRGGGGYVVAALKHEREARWSVFFLSSSSANAWRRVPARPAPELGDWFPWEISEVFAYGGRFWWVDLRRGLLSFSPDSLLQEEDDTPVELQFTRLPNVTMEEAKNPRASKDPVQPDRCVTASRGRLRYVEMRARRELPGSLAVEPPPLCDDCRGGIVGSWTLDDSGGAWAKDHALKLADVWRDESYQSMGLPKEVPEYPLVHPFDPNVVHFSVKEGGYRYDHDGHVFTVDLRTKQVKSCASRCHNYYDRKSLEPVFGGSSE
ncbi:hypothetical protein ACP70R_022457 [Stipagrostis hirtigluma subsp. patula]